MLIPWEKEDNLDKQRPWKNVLTSSPTEGDSYSSENKHDKWTAPGTKLFPSAEGLREEGHNNKEVCWDLSSVKVASSDRELSSIEAGNWKTSIAK
jgi:hypothetical protein